MPQIEKIKELVETILKQNDLYLYDISWLQEGKNTTLQIAIMRADGSMNLDDCVSMSEQISQKLDEEDIISSEYFLEVCSAGAERELRTFEEMKNAQNEYVFVKLNNVVSQGLYEIYGILSNVEEQQIEIEYKIKTATKKVKIDIDNIALIRLAVKL